MMKKNPLHITPFQKADSAPRVWVRRFAVGLLVGVLLAGSVFSVVSAAPLPQTNTNTPTATTAVPSVVISEFRTNGPSGGNDEFIELFNPTNASVNISGLKIMVSNASGTIGARATIPTNATTLDFLPGQHYLIVNSNGYSGVVAQDISYGTGVVDTGGIALTLSDGTTIIDQVGMSAGSVYGEGSRLSGLSGNLNQSYERRPGDAYGSCNDVGDNNADFQTIMPSKPQNSSVVDSPCSVSLLYTPTFTTTPTPTSTQTLSSTPSLTPTETGTSTVTFTPTITSTRTITPTPTITPTGPTSTATRTNTLTLLPTFTATFTPVATFTSLPTFTPTVQKIIINEVAWAGTQADANDEWIELYNPNNFPVRIKDWKLSVKNGQNLQFTITLSDKTIPRNGFYLLERGDDNTIRNITADQIYTGALGNTSGDYLVLYDFANRQVDTANVNQGNWPAGSSSPIKCSMERASASAADIDGGWFTNNNNNSYRRGQDAAGNLICGSPGGQNWAYTVTATHTRTPTRTRTPTVTRTRTLTRTATKSKTPTPYPLAVSSVVINEFLVKPRSDWNQDGKINAGDAFIEIKNLSTISVSLSGWYLDDQNGDSSPYYLPSVVLEAGARKVYFASVTNIVLSEASDSVRLFKPGAISDVYTYTEGVKVPNQSWCRLPDGANLSWIFGCEPTPELTNTLAKTIIVDNQSELAICLSKTIPRVVYDAECLSAGLAVWSPNYWDGELQREYPLYIERDGQIDIVE